jgi:hypothetical protein
VQRSSFIWSPEGSANAAGLGNKHHFSKNMFFLTVTPLYTRVLEIVVSHVMVPQPYRFYLYFLTGGGGGVW